MIMKALKERLLPNMDFLKHNLFQIGDRNTFVKLDDEAIQIQAEIIADNGDGNLMYKFVETINQDDLVYRIPEFIVFYFQPGNKYFAIGYANDVTYCYLTAADWGKVASNPDLDFKKTIDSGKQYQLAMAFDVWLGGVNENTFFKNEFFKLVE